MLSAMISSEFFLYLIQDEMEISSSLILFLHFCIQALEKVEVHHHKVEIERAYLLNSQKSPTHCRFLFVHLNILSNLHFISAASQFGEGLKARETECKDRENLVEVVVC